MNRQQSELRGPTSGAIRHAYWEQLLVLLLPTIATMSWIPLCAVLYNLRMFQRISGTSALLLWKMRETRQREAELLIRLDRVALVAVHKDCWAEIQRFIESTSSDDAAFRYECAAESARGVNGSNMHLKNVADETKRLLDD